MRAAWVAVPVPAVDLLTYRVPDGIALPPIGARVLVPVGTRVLTGCVVRVDEKQAPLPDGGDDAIKDIIEVLDEGPFLPEQVVGLALWVAEYYACGPGEAIAAAMPPFAWIESRRQVQITERGRTRTGAGQHGDDGRGDERANAGAPRLSATQSLVLRALADGKPRSLAQIAGAGKNRSPGLSIDSARSAVAALERAGLATIGRVMRGTADASRTVSYATLTTAGHAVTRTGVPAEVPSASPLALGARQREVLDMLVGAPSGLAVPTLRDRQVSADTIRRLAARGLIALRRERVERDPFDADRGRARVAPPAVENGMASRVLTDEQADALTRLGALLDARRFEAVLLHGVTGSGKTEIYLRLAARARDAGRRSLVLVPEIALTPALAGTFRVEFGERVAILHSGLSDGERYDQWQRIRRDDIDVVVGTRSAVFAPLGSIGVIVVDE
jgi:primosomal protein N' (replication factor Y)